MVSRSAVVAASLALASGALGASAGTTANLAGADSLFGFTSAILAACPGTVGPYAGGGSDSAEAAMLAGVQHVAPMGRFLGPAACDGGPAASPAQSEGLVVGLDGVSLLGARATAGGSACNGDDNVDCVSTFEPFNGAAYDTVVGSYTFQGWRDVLRVLLAGFDHDAGHDWRKRDCKSAIRQSLADQYGTFFENQCAATSGERSGDPLFDPVCTQIRHVFRPGDFSAATETMVSVLDLPAVVPPESSVTLDTGAGATTVTQHTGASPFCNAVRPAFVFPPPQPTALVGADDTWDPTSTETAANGRETAVYRAAYQDNDPVRRLCAGTGASSGPAEDVCSHSGDLGLVLPINDVEEPAPRTNADRYNAAPCVVGHITSSSAPDVYDAISQKKVICGRDGHGLVCPNGDTCTPFGGCYVPADASGNAQCLATERTTPAFAVSDLAVPRANPETAALNDGRSYNAHLYTQLGFAAAYQLQSAAHPYRVTGAFHRIHASHSLAPAADAGAAPTCQEADLGSQIACLVTASPCSIGYAGLAAASANPLAGPIKIDKQSPHVSCIQGGLLYPLSRKLYVNAVAGFGALTGSELQLAGCMTDLAQPGLSPPTPAGLVTTEIAAAGFIPIPPFAVGGGEPYCEDFDEAVLCGATGNRVACATSPAGLSQFPSTSTVCGDGLVDPYEECDRGPANGPPPAPCSTTCRLND